MATEDETYDPFPRPGDSDFTSFPKTATEDIVYYSIFYLPATPPTPQNARLALGEVLQTIKKQEKEYFKAHIWQREAFSVVLEQYNERESLTNQLASKADLPAEDAARDNRLPHWYLKGSTTFADSLADESAILFLLKEVSLQHADVWIRTADNDGEFLLIEAAHTLPEWLDPDTGANRPWIHAGQIHILPASLSSNNAPNPDRVTEGQALQHLSSPEHQTITDPATTKAAFFRIRDHPAALAASMHSTTLVIPRKLAYLLHTLPSLISPISESWYIRDAVSLSHIKLAAESRLGLSFPIEDLVTCVVKFTRVSYAQILAASPPAYLQDWIDAIPDGDEDSSEYAAEQSIKRRQTSAKIIAGAEILLADVSRSNERPVREIQLLLSDLEDGEEELPTDEDIRTWPATEESEDWLNVDYESLDRELKGQIARPDLADETAVSKDENGGKDKQTQSGFGDKAAQENLRRIVEGFEKFLGDERAGLDGAEFGGESDDDASDDGHDGNGHDLEAETSNRKKKAKGNENVREDTDDDDSIEEIQRAADIIQSLREMTGKSVPQLKGEAGAEAFWASVRGRAGGVRTTGVDVEDESEGNSSLLHDLQSDPLEEIQRLVAQSSQRRDGPLSTEQLGLDLGELDDSDDDWNDQEEEEEDSGDEITLDDVQKVMLEMEAELKKAGVFARGSGSENANGRMGQSTKGKEKQALRSVVEEGEESDEDDNDDNDDDAREILARNILQAFKEGQGTSGPAAGMLGAMGLSLPRDEDDVHKREN